MVGLRGGSEGWEKSGSLLFGKELDGLTTALELTVDLGRRAEVEAEREAAIDNDRAVNPVLEPGVGPSLHPTLAIQIDTVSDDTVNEVCVCVGGV